MCIMQKTILIFFITLSFSALGQSKLMESNFRSPVDFDMYLSGTFAELRGGHFHAGIDIKTYEQVGKVVKMIEDGYISRIKISRYGYGKAIYVNHTNGYTSVFGHLDGFNRTISDYIEAIQQKRQEYEFDVAVPKDALFYKKGNIIAYSGNSGYSFGPHIHFEIRESDSQKPVNPLFFGYDVNDDLPPVIRGVKIYDDHGETLLKTSHLSKGKYHIPGMDTFIVNGNVSFGIDAIDMLNGAPNRNGVYNYQLFRDDSLVFHWKADRFSFYETRYINALIDYAEYVESGRKFMTTRRLPNNKLSMYEFIKDDGDFEVNAGDTTQWVYELTDIKGNLSTISFVTIGDSSRNTTADTICLKPEYQLNPFDAATITHQDLRLDFERNSFYETASFNITEKPADSLPVSYQIGNKHIPVHRYFTLSCDPGFLEDSLKPKALWMIFDDSDGDFKAVSTTYKAGLLQGYSRSFGWYTVKVDTVAPTIEWPVKKNAWRPGDELRISIKDNLSGVEDYNLYVDGKWLIAEYDAKNDLLIYTISDKLSKGKHTFQCELTDGKNNFVSDKTVLFILQIKTFNSSECQGIIGDCSLENI